MSALILFTPDETLEQVMVLEYKYGAQGISVREYILRYLDEVYTDFHNFHACEVLPIPGVYV